MGKVKEMTAQKKHAELNAREKAEREQQEAIEAIARTADILKIRRVKGGKDKVKTCIRYRFISNNHTTVNFIESDDTPREDFVNTMAELAPHVSKMINKLPNEVNRQAGMMEVKGVTFATIKDIPYAMVTVTQYLPNGKAFTYTTPAMAMESADGSPSDTVLDEEMVEVLDRLVEEARHYIAGRRGQPGLFDEHQAEPATEAVEQEQELVEAE